jgi:putative transport protein
VGRFASWCDVPVIELLASHPLVLLFAVAAVGVPLGRVPILGVRVGVAAVLFVGLAFGALDPRLRLPEIVLQLGLALFVYTIGLASGRAFLRAFDPRGLRANLLVLAALAAGAGATVLMARAFGIDPATAAGMYTGATTNTPALAGVVEALRGAEETTRSAPVVAYSLAYPGGVLGVIVVIAALQRWWRTDYAAESRGLRDYGVGGEQLRSVTVRVTREELGSAPVQTWREREGWHAIMGRYRRGADVRLVQGDTVLQPGDEVTLVGTERDLAIVAPRLGDVTGTRLDLERSELDFRRLFVSRPEVAGRTLAELRLPQRLGAVVTRVRRGDAFLLPTADLRLELGDRVRVVARQDQMAEVERTFGDSYQALSEVDVRSLAIGLGAGLLLGLVPVPLPGGVVLRLGFAGGPLLAALALGAIGRSGPLVWTLPYSANLTLRQFGLLLFLAGVGTGSGFAFASTLRAGAGLDVVLGGLALTVTLAATTLFVGHRLLRLPMNVMVGVVCAQHTQPAALGYAVEQTGNDLPHVGYATVFPVATLAKIALAQFVLLLV